MHAIIETGGKQYRVAPGDVIRVEKLAGDIGSEVELAVKASFKEGGELVSGGKVTGTYQGARGGETPLEDVSVSGNMISFKRKQMGRNGEVTFTYTGTVSGDEMKLKQDNGQGMPVEFTAKRAS